MSLKKYSGLMVFLMAIAMYTGCKEKEHDDREAGARDLYLQLVSLTKNYTDSINAASDSTDIDAIYARYEKAFDNISHNVVPDTDLFMKEGENDTILMLQSEIIKAKLRKQSAQKMHLASDTIESESISELPVQ